MQNRKADNHNGCRTQLASQVLVDEPRCIVCDNPEESPVVILTPPPAPVAHAALTKRVYTDGIDASGLQVVVSFLTSSKMKGDNQHGC